MYASFFFPKKKKYFINFLNFTFLDLPIPSSSLSKNILDCKGKGMVRGAKAKTKKKTSVLWTNDSSCAIHRKPYVRKDKKNPLNCLDPDLLTKMVHILVNPPNLTKSAISKLKRDVKAQMIGDVLGSDDPLLWPDILAIGFSRHENADELQTVQRDLKRQIKANEPFVGMSVGELSVTLLGDILSDIELHYRGTKASHRTLASSENVLQKIPAFFSVGVVNEQQVDANGQIVRTPALKTEVKKFKNQIVRFKDENPGKAFSTTCGWIFYSGNHYRSALIHVKVNKFGESVVTPMYFDSLLGPREDLSPIHHNLIDYVVDKVLSFATRSDESLAVHQLFDSHPQKDGVSCGLWSLSFIHFMIKNRAIPPTRAASKFHSEHITFNPDSVRSLIYTNIPVREKVGNIKKTNNSWGKDIRAMEEEERKKRANTDYDDVVDID
jgi:hypothetical protein